MKRITGLLLCFWVASTSALLAAQKPNIVFILTDNQGAWQLGCYGNPDFKTPNIDRMASEGVRFSNAFANNAVCSPTRATYLTGLTPSQHGVHRYLAKGRLQVGPQASYTLEEFTTLPEVLHREGYVCGLSGKWHLGDNMNPQDGFSFWVTKQHGHSTGFLNQEVIEDGKFKIIEKHLSEYWTDRGIEFVEKTQRENPDKPFFLFLAYNGPYTLSGAMREKVPSPWSDPYRDSQLPSFPRPEKIHPWQRNQHDLIGDLEAGRNLAGQVTAVDAGVGRVLSMLKEKNLDENTIVIYAADQGAVAGHAGFWGMGDHTTPLHGRDGTMHIPMIFRWPGKIPSGRTEDHIVTNYDFLPSVLSLLGLPTPAQQTIAGQRVNSPGRDFSPALLGEPLKNWDDEVFYEFENVRAIRTRDWKYVERLGEAPEVELYDLKADPDELNNLAGIEQHSLLRTQLRERLVGWFTKHSDARWDLWNGGNSKSRTGTARQIAEGIKKRDAEKDDSPKPKAIRLQGLHAYPGTESVAAGETIDFHVSSEFPYRLRVTKLGQKVDDRSSDLAISRSPNLFEPKVQPIHPGSYIKLNKGLPAAAELNGLTLDCWVRPWNLKRWQGIVTQHDFPDHCGYGLFLNGAGRAVFHVGTGGQFDREAQIVGPKLNLHQWHHLVGTWDGDQAILWVDGKNAGSWQSRNGLEMRAAGRAPLRIGAYGDNGQVTNFLDGDIAMPAIYRTALGADAIAARYESRGLKAPTDQSLLAYWPLDEERGAAVADVSGNGFDGEVVNLGTWMIGGPSFDGTKVDRYDASYDPANDPVRGHGLRLASDDLYDCGWEVAHTFRVPTSAKSGIYAAWFDFEKNGVAHHYPVTFVVNKAKTAVKAPIAVMCSTTTWRAYGGTPFAKNVPHENRNWPTGGQTNDPANPPAYCMYRDHASGQPTYQIGLRIPWPAAGPDVRYSAENVGYSHLMRGERFTHVWLEKQGYDFDVVTNLDLHRDPDLLRGYKSLIINGHDEYWSQRMYDGLDRYLRGGGTTAVLSGNTMFWRITVDDELGVMECRKYGSTIGGRKLANVGEIYHSRDGKRGSLMRNCGLPPWKNIGLECSGWWGGANNGVYTATAPDHFLFQSPERIDFSDRQYKTFGGAKAGHRKAGGHEGDIRLSSFSPATNIPDGAVMPQEPTGIETLATLKRSNARVLDYFANFGQQKDATLVDMVYWERGEGGKVFNAGAIGFGWALDADPKQTQLLRNVLFHLAGVKAKTPYDPAWLDEEAADVGVAESVGSKTSTRPVREIVPETDHTLILRAGDARISGGSVKVNPRHGALAWWKTTNDSATWTVRGAKSGSYTVVLDYAVPDQVAGQQFSLHTGEATLRGTVATTGGWSKWEVRISGEIEITKPDLEISFGPSAKVVGEDLIDLRSIQLIPIGSPRLESLKPPPAKPDPNIPSQPKQLAGNSPAPVLAAGDGVFELSGRTASLFGESITLIPDREDSSHSDWAIAGWKRNGERASWKLRGLKEGRYDLLVDWAMPRLPGGLQKAAVTLDGNQVFTGNIRTTEGEDRFAKYVIGTIALPAGDHEFSFGPHGSVANTWVRLRSLRLVPAVGDGEFKSLVSSLTVPDGFTIEAAALPPLISHPMMACLDDRGRMFVAESAGMNAKAPELLEKRPHRIVMLEDQNGDGVFDKSTVFADNLVLPNGAQWHDGALYVCSPPYIWRFEDTTGDSHADKQTPVGGKFGFNGMSSAFHGPVLGPDGRLYYCGGQHGWTLGDTSPGFDLAGPWISRSPGVFSMWPSGNDPVNRAQGGMANPVEVTFSSEGEVFGTVAVYENVNGRTDALLHWLHGSVYNLRRPPVHARTSRHLLPPMSRRGWVAPPGLTRYRSGKHAAGFGERYRDDIFMTEFNTHRVYRIKPERSGASYTTTDEVFLESTSPYTHFTDVMEDADGSLLVVDTGGWFLYGCPTSAIERPEIKGAVYRIRRTDAIKATNAVEVNDPRGIRLDWNHPSARWLDDDRFVVRDRVKAELAKQGESIVPALVEILADARSSERHRREAVWTLTRIDHASARAAAGRALDDSSASVRLTAARSLSTRPDVKAAKRLVQLVSTDRPEIQREAATALGRIGYGPAVPVLLDALSENNRRDAFLDHSLIYALIEIDDWSRTLAGLQGKNPNAQRGALVALAEMKSSRIESDQVAPLLGATDPELRAEALRVAMARPQWGDSVIGFLRSSLADGSASAGLGDALLAFVQNAQVQHLVADALLVPATRDVALEVIRRAELKTAPQSWQVALKSALKTSPDPSLIETIGGLQDERRVQRPEYKVALTKLATDNATPPSTRLAAIDVAFPRASGGVTGSVIQFVASQFKPRNLPKHRLTAARILGRLARSQSQQLICAELVAGAGPLEINPLLDAFQTEPDLKTLEVLAGSLASSPGLFGLTAERLEAIFNNHAAASPLIEQLRAAELQRETRLHELSALIAPKTGDLQRGKAVFTKAKCDVCHKAKGSGGVIGPELTTIGAIRTERDLLEAIAYPSATFAREYESYVILTEDGAVVTGRLGIETDQTLEVIDAQGKSVRVPTDQILSRKTASVSLMPSGLDRLLTVDELADLVAYLRSMK